MSATSYYSTKARVGARTERIRTEMDRSSAYIIDSSSYASSKPSTYTSTLGRQSSFREESSRPGRSRIRDSSLDVYSRPRRSSSMEYSAPVKMRTRDLSMDYSNTYVKPTYTANNRAPRPTTTNFDDEEHSPEYRKIMEKTDTTLNLMKYSKKDEDAAAVDGLLEEERRSKAYNKIINQGSATQMEKDAYRQTMCDIFADCKSFSAKTMNAINKEILYKEDKGPKKNYGWRKDMESYEDTLEKMSEHRRNVRESTRATTASSTQYRDLNARLRDYDKECKRDVDEDPTPAMRISVSMTPSISRKSEYISNTDPPNTYTNGISSYTNGTSSYTNTNNKYSNGISSSINDDDYEDTTINKPKRGSWRKDLEAYEENLSQKKMAYVNNRSKDDKEEPIKVNARRNVETVSSSSTTRYNTKAEEVKPVSVTIKIEDPKSAEVPQMKKSDPVAHKNTYSSDIPKWKKPEETHIEEAKLADSKLDSSWKNSKVINTEKSKPIEIKTQDLKKPETNKVVTTSTENKNKETKLEETKPKEPLISKWKKSGTNTNEEVKAVETPKSTPKWKKPEQDKNTEEQKSIDLTKVTSEKKEETKPNETPKTVPKWKKPESSKPAEVKPVEPEKPVPKWKKSAPSAKPKEEPKPVEVPKPTPKWKKPEAIKKEEPKPKEPEKPVPKWKKQAAVKKEEPKPAEPEKPVEVPKPTPKWKKPEATKKEEPKQTEPEKPVPKWKKPVVAKKEEPKPVEPEKPQPEPTAPEPQLEEDKCVDESRLKPDMKTETKSTESAAENKEEKKEGDQKSEKKEEEEEEDNDGMKAMAKEQHSKFSAMDEEFAAGASKLSALRAKMKALRMKHKAAAEADAQAEAARQG